MAECCVARGESDSAFQLQRSREEGNLLTFVIVQIKTWLQQQGYSDEPLLVRKLDGGDEL